MDTLDDSDNNAKISDSAYSNSCSNSQSRRSQSSKSTHSGSSGSSGYGGKPSTSGSSNNLEQPSKKDKDAKKRKLSQTEVKIVEEPLVVECIPHCEIPDEEILDVVESPTPPPSLALPENVVENMDISPSELTCQNHEVQIATMQGIIPVGLESSCQVENEDAAGFSCAISMHDGVVAYTTENVTTNLGFPKDIWIGRSFIDFVHPKDRNTFASQITNGLAMPKMANETQNKAESPVLEDCTMVCRIRTYRSLNISFGVKDRTVAYMPFLLKFSFKDITEDDDKIVYLIIQASPIYSGYQNPNESKENATPFIIRHSAAGILEYIDIDSVPYLGYLPQDLHNKNALMMYHPDDLPYLKMIYEMIVKDGSVSKCLPYRMLAQNGDYVKLETEWSSFTNPWSMRLEFVIGKHYIIEGPATPDVFLSPPPPKLARTSEEIIKTQLADSHRECILMIMKAVITKPTKKVKQQMNDRHSLSQIMDDLLEVQPKPEEELMVETFKPDLNCYEKDTVMLGGISPHHDNNDSKSSTETPLSYNQINYNENLQRFFDSHDNYCLEDKNRNYANGAEAVKSPIGMMSLLAQNSSDSNDLSSSASSTAVACNSLSPPANLVDFYPLRLTESLLTKHNNHMEKELVKCHRGARTGNKWERAFNTKQKKKEHLARCNAGYKPAVSFPEKHQQHGVKRSLMPMESGIAQKLKSGHSRIQRPIQNNAAEMPRFAPTNAGTHTTWQGASITAQSNAANSYAKNMQQQMPMHTQLSGGFPMYYAPNTDPGVFFGRSHLRTPLAPVEVPPPPGYQATLMPPPMHPHMAQYPDAPIPWMYPNVYDAPYIYHQMPYNQQQAMMPQPGAYNPSAGPLGLADSNFMQSIEPVPESAEKMERAKTSEPSGHSGQISDETMDRTDGESSYSSFYSSFLKTESSSAEDSSDPNKTSNKINNQAETSSAMYYNYEPHEAIQVPKRKVEPQWMDEVFRNPDLLYKYQVPLKSEEEILQADLEKLQFFEQPNLVNEQLGQLYLDLQLQGVASRLTLEEGITSSSSSGEETCFSGPSARAGRQVTRHPRRKHEYSRLNMIYEEDAPLPPPAEFAELSVMPN